MKKVIILIALLMGMVVLSGCTIVSLGDTNTNTVTNTNTDTDTAADTNNSNEIQTNNVVEVLESLGLTKELAEYNAEIFENVGVTYLTDVTAGPGSGIYDLQYYICENYGAKNFALSFTFENGYLYRIVFNVYPVFKDDEGYNVVLYDDGEYKNKIVFDENGQIEIE